MSISGFQEIFFDQMSNDFGIGLGGELMAFFNQLLLQKNIVLDDPVMHYHHTASAITVRMRIFLGGASVGRPAGVTDPIGAVDGLEADDLFQVAQLALGAAHLQCVTIAGHSDSGRVVAPVLEALQAIENYGHDPFLANVPHYPTHNVNSLRTSRKSELRYEVFIDFPEQRSEEHTSNSSHRCISYAVFCLKKK